MRRLVPPARAWLRILSAPSSYLLVIAFVATVAAKLSALPSAGAIAACAAIDGVLAFGIGALLALLETRRIALLLTVPVSLAIAVPAVINALTLAITGEQLTWQAVQLGLERWDDVSAVAGDQLATGSVGAMIAVVAAALIVPLVATWAAARPGESPPTGPAARAFGRAHVLVVLGAASALLVLVPRPDGLAAERLARSGVIDSYLGLAGAIEAAPAPSAEPVRASFRGYDRPALLGGGRLDAAAGTNVLIVVWESTRYDHTSLAGDAALAATPNLAALAERGLVATTARAVVPHTSKSLFAMLCGRLPLLQQAIFELSADVPPECLPGALARAGWQTALIQSAVGGFEQRPRLAHGLGFAEFLAQEDVGGRKLGYLASDDESLAAPALAFVDRAAGRPFLAVVLTSATHHPYSLPPTVIDRVRADSAPANTPAHRYARLVEAQDHMLGALIAGLDQRGLLARTVVVVVGDHGEGFGDKGVRQHDNNFFEEGLRVPLVVAGPGVPRRDVGGNASLIDVAPTLIALLGGQPAAALDGDSLLAPAPDRPRWFVCWYDDRCRGFALGRRKVVVLPDRRRAFAFDLAEDPGEARPQPLLAAETALLPELQALVETHRTVSWDVQLPAIELGSWHCPAGGSCTQR